MKTIKFLLLLCLVTFCDIGIKAIGPGSLYIGAEGSYSVVYDSSNNYGLFGVNANYSLNLTSRWFFSPEVSLYYQHMPSCNTLDYFPGWEPPADYSESRNTFGGGLGAYLGFKFANPVFFFTGPMAMCNFYQKERVHSYGETYYYKFSDHRANMLWRFGLGLDVWRLRVRASYDLYVTDRTGSDHKKNGAITLGIAFKM